MMYTEWRGDALFIHGQIDEQTERAMEEAFSARLGLRLNGRNVAIRAIERCFGTRGSFTVIHTMAPSLEPDLAGYLKTALLEPNRRQVA